MSLRRNKIVATLGCATNTKILTNLAKEGLRYFESTFPMQIIFSEGT